jgi:hypothetical protein
MRKRGRTPARQTEVVAAFRHGSKTDRKDPRPFLPVTVCGKRKVRCLALVDTGADVVYVSPGVARKAGLEALPLFGEGLGWRRYKLQAMRGRICTKGLPCVKATFDIQRPWGREGFQVILGCNWLEALNCVVDVPNRRLLRGAKK